MAGGRYGLIATVRCRRGELPLDAIGLALGDAVDDAIKLAITKRRLAPARIPRMQEAAHELKITAMTEQVPDNPGGGHVAVLSDRRARELRPHIRRKRLLGAVAGGW